MPSNDYMRQWRSTPAGRAALLNQKAREKARRRALVRLVALYPSQWERLYDEELIKIKEEST